MATPVFETPEEGDRKPVADGFHRGVAAPVTPVGSSIDYYMGNDESFGKQSRSRYGNRLLLGGAVLAIVFVIVGGIFITNLLVVAGNTHFSEPNFPTHLPINLVIKNAQQSTVMLTAKNITGSGVIASKHGHILTSFQIAAKVKDKFVVTFADGHTDNARVTKVVPSRGVALLETDDPIDEPVAKLSASGLLERGDKVLALGGPKTSNSAVKPRAVNAMNRQVTIPGQVSQVEPYRGVKDAPRYLRDKLNELINPPKKTKPVKVNGLLQISGEAKKGSEGGPLIDTRGRVMGINLVVKGKESTVAFAIPIETAKALIKE